MAQLLPRCLFVILCLFSVSIQAITNEWKFRTGASVFSSPAIGMQGVVYFGSYDGRLYALDLNGKQRWNYFTGGKVFSSPTIGIDGAILFGTMAGKVGALNSLGEKIWETTLTGELYGSASVDPEGHIYIGSTDGHLYALDRNGMKKWAFPTGGSVTSQPAILCDGTIIFGSYDRYLYALNPDGTKKWQFQAIREIYSSPAVGHNDAIYFSSLDGRLYALTSRGAKIWEFSTGSQILCSPIIGPDGTIYFGSYNTKLYAINPDGTKKWEYTLPGAIRGSPTIASDGTIYIGCLNHKFYAFNSGGTLKWEFLTEDEIFSSPAIGPDGMVYFGSLDRNLYAIKETSNLANSFWPIVGRDLQHSGSMSAKRYLPDGYSIGARMLVQIETWPPISCQSHSVEDQILSNWIVTKISHGGSFDTINRRVKFGPYFDHQQRLLSYELTPGGTQTNLARMTGVLVADGRESVTGGASQMPYVALHPADNNPIEGRLSINELTAYGAAWKRGDSWPIAPNPIPVSFLMQAAKLWKEGEYYYWNTNNSIAPGWWVNTQTLPTVVITNVLPTNSPSGTANNVATVQMPRLYQPGKAFEVRLSVIPATNRYVYAVEEQLPRGWQPSQISNEGTFDVLNRKIKWGPFFDPEPRTLSYQLLPPFNYSGSVSVNGTASFDGLNVNFSGQRYATDNPIPPALNPLLINTNGMILMEITGETGYSYRIEASTNCVDWQLLTNTFIGTNIIQYLDSSRNLFDKRFYRVTLP